MTVRLRDIVLSVRYGDAALVGESAGYLILGAADASLEMPRAASLDSIVVADDGSVSLDASPCPFEQSEGSLRQMLAQLLTLVRTPCPNLLRVSGRKESLGSDGLVRELEAALVPVNRRASRRSLARLVRDAKKSAKRGHELAAVERVQLPEPVFTEPADPEPEPEAIAQPEAVAVPATEVYSEPSPVAPVVLTMPMQSVLPAPKPIVAQPLPVVVEPNLARSTTTQITRPTKSPYTVAREASTGTLEADRVAQVYATAGQSLVELDEFSEVDELDEALTQVYQAPVAPMASPVLDAAPVSAVMEQTHSVTHESRGGAVERQVTPPAPVIYESPLPPSSCKKLAPIADDVSLIPHTVAVRERRPSDIEELLDRIQVSTQPDDALYAGLKDLSRVDLSPVAPPVGMSWAE